MYEPMPASRLARRALFLLVVTLAGMLPARWAGAGGFVLAPSEQLTPNGLNPQVSGARVVWEGTGGTGTPTTDREIFLYDGGVTTQLTENGVHDLNPRVSPAGVLWERDTGVNAEIYFHDGNSETRLSNNAIRDLSTSLSGNRAAWYTNGKIGDDLIVDLFIWDGVNPPMDLTGTTPPDNVADTLPYVNGNNTVWVRGSTPNQKIMKHDGTSVTEITSSTHTLADPVVEDNLVAWEGFKERDPNPITTDREIYLYDGVSPTPINLSNNDVVDSDPQISGGRVTWWGGSFNNNQVFLWDNGIVTQLSNSGLNQLPKIDGQFIVWQGWEGFGGGDLEIFLWDGMQVHQITDNAIDDTMPQISGNHLVWQSGGGVWHTFIVPEPSGLVLATVGLVACLTIIFRRRAAR